MKLNEDDLLADERKRLGNFEKLFDAIKSSYEGLQGDQRGLEYIGHAMGHLETAVDLDEKYSEVMEAVSNSYYLA